MSNQSSKGKAWEQLRKQVLQRDQYTCVYCNREATQVDHVIPKASGGRDELSNLVAACLLCNSTKGKRTNIRMNYYNPRYKGKL